MISTSHINEVLLPVSTVSVTDGLCQDSRGRSRCLAFLCHQHIMPKENDIGGFSRSSTGKCLIRIPCVFADLPAPLRRKKDL